MTGAPARAEVELEVPFHDVDLLGVVWHGHYYRYLDPARAKLMRDHALDGTQLMGTGFRFFVQESRCKHSSPLHYGDRVRIAASFGDVTHRIDIHYELTNLTTGKLAARALTRLVTVDESGRLRLRTPETILTRLEAPR